MNQDSISSKAGGASLIQVELGLGKNALILLWLSSFVSAAAVVAMVFLFMAWDDTKAHVNVLQYDLAQVKAQLIEQGLYEPTSH